MPYTGKKEPNKVFIEIKLNLTQDPPPTPSLPPAPAPAPALAHAPSSKKGGRPILPWSTLQRRSKRARTRRILMKVKHKEESDDLVKALLKTFPQAGGESVSDLSLLVLIKKLQLSQNKVIKKGSLQHK